MRNCAIGGKDCTLCASKRFLRSVEVDRAISTGPIAPFVPGTVVRKNPHAMALGYLHYRGTISVRTKHACPRFDYWQ